MQQIWWCNQLLLDRWFYRTTLKSRRICWYRSHRRMWIRSNKEVICNRSRIRRNIMRISLKLMISMHWKYSSSISRKPTSLILLISTISSRFPIRINLTKLASKKLRSLSARRKSLNSADSFFSYINSFIFEFILLISSSPLHSIFLYLLLPSTNQLSYIRII